MVTAHHTNTCIQGSEPVLIPWLVSQERREQKLKNSLLRIIWEWEYYCAILIGSAKLGVGAKEPEFGID